MISGLAGLLVLLVALADLAQPRDGNWPPRGPIVVGLSSAALAGTFVLGYSAFEMAIVSFGLVLVALVWKWFGRSGDPSVVVVLSGLVVVAATSWIGFESVVVERWGSSVAAAVGERTAGETLVTLGVLLAVTATGNRLVRIAVSAVGQSPTPAQTSRIRSGRVIGTLERLLIVLLLIADSPSAVAGVLAAKGILRYPEIRADDASIGELAEYVLVGTLASVLVAVVGAILIG